MSYDANPATGFAVYNTYGSGSAWAVYGGTSAGAPQWSALIAIADQGRAAQNLSSLDGSTQTLYALYGLKSPSAGFHDVTTGSNGSILTYGYTGYRSRFGSGYGFTSTTNSATVGYDTVTGLGTPAANVLVPALVGVTGTGRTLAFNVVATTPAAATSTASTTGATAHFDPTSPIVIITNPGSSTTSPISSPTPTPTQSQSQTLIVIIPVGTGSLARSTTFIILLAPANLPLPTPTYYAATGHSGSFSIAANIAFLTAAPSTMIRPPQSLDIHPTYESEVPPLRSSDDEGPFPPLDYTTPALGPEFIARGESATGLDILAITRHARELGRVAARGSIELGPRATPITEPILTDLTVRDRTPTLDPALAGVVVVVGGALALRPDRSGRRRWSIRRV